MPCFHFFFGLSDPLLSLFKHVMYTLSIDHLRYVVNIFFSSKVEGVHSSIALLSPLISFAIDAYVLVTALVQLAALSGHVSMASLTSSTVDCICFSNSATLVLHDERNPSYHR